MKNIFNYCALRAAQLFKFYCATRLVKLTGILIPYKVTISRLLLLWGVIKLIYLCFKLGFNFDYLLFIVSDPYFYIVSIFYKLSNLAEYFSH